MYFWPQNAGRKLRIFNLSSFNSIGNNLLQELRDRDLQKNKWVFRRNLYQLGQLLAYELSKTLPYHSKIIQTPLDRHEIDILTNPPTLITILRAAIPFYEGVQEIFKDAETGFIGAVREKEGDLVKAKLTYYSIPETEGKDVVLIDPMLATGKSIVKIYDSLLSKMNYRSLHLITAVAAPEGISHLKQKLPTDLNLWLGALDKNLDEHYYIVPGLGDAGDLSFGESKTKS